MSFHLHHNSDKCQQQAAKPNARTEKKKKIVPFYKSAKLNKLNAPHYLQLAQLQYATNMCCPPKKQHCS